MADRPSWETGLAIKLVNWLYKKNSHCKESAVVAPLPADKYFGGVSPSPRYRTGRRIGKRGAEKIIELLGAENRDQQLQIHALLEQSGIDADSASDDESDSGCDDRNVEQAPPHLSKPSGMREAAGGNGSSRLPRTSPQSNPTQLSPKNHHFQGSSQTGTTLSAHSSSRDGFQARTGLGVNVASPQLSLLLKLPAEESNRRRDHSTTAASNGMSSCFYSHQTTRQLIGCPARQCLPCLAKSSPNHQTSKHSFARATPYHSPPVTPLHPGFGPLNYQGNHFEHPVTCRNLIYSKHPHTPSCSPPQRSSCGHSVPQRFEEDGAFLKGYGGNQDPPRRSASSINPSPKQIRQSSILAYSEDRQWTPSQSPFLSPHFSPPKTPHSPHSHQSLCTSPIQSPTGLVLGEKLGSGSFGAVYKGQDAQTGQQFALKVLHDERISPQEVAVLSRLNHHHIVKYFGTATLRDGRFCILLELMKCSLASVLKDSNRLDETMIRVYTRQILRGLEYLHDKQIVHRDIKCGNILLDAKGRAKLADFGVAKKIDLSIAKSCKGTLFYMAPEVLVSANDGRYGLPADIWSLGCTVIEMADGKPPWSGVGMMSFMVKMKEGQCPPIPKGLSRDAVHFIRSCLAPKPENRPTASTLLRHPFVKSISDLERL